VSTQLRAMQFLTTLLVGCASTTVVEGGHEKNGPPAPIHQDAGLDGAVCHPLAPGSCPVMPANGVVCSPMVASPIPDCGTRGTCIPSEVTTGSGGASAPPETCRIVCADENGACPPRADVCTPQASCSTAADCHGDLPTLRETCPLLPDGTPSADGRAYFECTNGYCEVAYCSRRSELLCNGPSGCPSYYLPTFDRSCRADADCVVGMHVSNCCYSQAIGISAHEKARFDAVEVGCSGAATGFCGCEGDVASSDGGVIPGGSSAYLVAVCRAGTCEAVYGPAACGSATCAAGEQCCVVPTDGGTCGYACGTSCPSPATLSCPH